MAIEVLVLAEDRTGWRKKGYIIYEKDSPANWGSQEGLPTFIRTTVTGAITVAEAKQYREQWTLTYEWQTQSHDVPTDDYRVLVYATPINVSGEGQLTWAKVSELLLLMNVSFVSEDVNGVVVDYTIYGTLTSYWFWGRDVSLVVFNELNYDSGTGVHRVEADYSSTGWNPVKVEKGVEYNGGVVVSHASDVIVFDINRSDVNSAMKQFFDETVLRKQEERRFYVDRDYVDRVVAGTELGQTEVGLDEKTKAEFLALIKDRIDE